MKMYLRLLLTIGFCLLMVACKTAQLTSKKYEGRATTTERADTIIERDTLMLIVHEKDDTVRIVQREVRWKERVKMEHDTLTVVKTDTIVKTIEPMIRSPASPLYKLRTWLRAILTATAIIILITIILKLKQLWEKSI